MPKFSTHSHNLLCYLALLTSFFVLIEIAVFIYGNEFYLGDFHFAAAHLKFPMAALPGILYFFLMQFLIHLLYLLGIWVWAELIAIAVPLTVRQMENVGIGLWLLGTFCILLANHYFYPNTKFACLTYFVAHLGLLKACLLLSASLLAPALLIACYGACVLFLRHQKARVLALGTLLLAAIGGGWHYFAPLPLPLTSVATATKPNVIIIGVDALRPDFLGFFGSSLKTVHIDRFLNQAAVFAENMTPDARTYPAWVSILTGDYPKQNGVRFDLSATMKFDPRQTLPALLRQQGYKTIFAMDEVRFSNIDQVMGFDQLITPPIGLNDFLLGTMNDFPLSNLLINTLVGRYLFPYSYANRAIYITYRPNTFLQLLRHTIKGPQQKPLFIAAHFCLPHSPYTWATRPNDHHYLNNYRAAIVRADLQVYDFLKMLKEQRLLDHAIVVLLSDHGEALELSGDRATEAELYIAGATNPHRIVPTFYPPSVKNEHVNQSAGHGTDILSFSQYHSLLAFRFMGVAGQQSNIIAGASSLLDIKPTILQLLKVAAPSGSGKSLVDFIAGKKAQLPAADFFIESDFSPAAVRSVHPETRKVLFQGIDYFAINPLTTRLTIKPSMADLIISSKQYADIYGDWTLALYPQDHKPHSTILVNLRTGEWTDDLQAPFAKQSPAKHMLHALKKFYGNDIGEF